MAVEHYWRCENCGKEIVMPDDGESKRCQEMIDEEFCWGEFHKIYKSFSFLLKGGGWAGPSTR